MPKEIQESYYVELPEQALALLNPLRGEILAQLGAPASAAEIGRLLGETAQRVNYHLKALEKVGLVRRVGSRQVRNLVEILYQAIAKTFVLADSLGTRPDTVQKLKDQSALAHLVAASERIKRDALLLLEQSEQDEQIPSAALHLQVALPDDETRSAFVEEYAAMVHKLVERYQQPDTAGAAYQVVVAVYPEPLDHSGKQEAKLPKK
ncbi:helix-turn-helix transcriptional regulator [Paenibacillus athensensis]|uniref:ArsR family transcriptional regulator n=1 Tax=Paenibacillus athensensis TaxID=1967502 RepID=A0A4Y8Q2G4_9BACL|nr:helix-turn-helix domain-containing protein [Paenibacillus athensensis]MCD1261093.1 helix-turn-helix transcriptional regulator [Paenibacillus athensensis]